MTRKAGVTDDHDHLEDELPHQDGEVSYGYVLHRRLELNAAASQPFTGLTQQDYAHALESAYKDTPEWEKLREAVRALQAPDFDPLYNPVVPDSDGLPQSAFRGLYVFALTQAHFIAYAKHHNLEPLTFTEAAREWTEANRQAYVETSQPTDQEVREFYAAGYSLIETRDRAELTPAEIEERRSGVYELIAENRRHQILKDKGLFFLEFVPSIELDPDTLQPAKPLRVLGIAHALTDLSKTYGPLNAQTIWRAPPGVKPPVPFFQYVWERARAEQLLEQKKAGQADSELASLADAAITIPTGQIMSHMYAHVANAEAFTQTDIKRYHLGNNQAPVHIRATSQLDASATLLSPADEMLEQIHKSLLSIKTHGAALLKTQLDLMSEAYKAGGDSPLFQYNLAEALERQGYARREARGYSHAAMQGLRERVVTLASQRIDVLNISGTDKKGRTVKEIDRALYWVLELERVRQEGDTIGAATVLLNDPNASIVTGWTIRPGLWWPFARISDFHLHIPSSVLELPTHGNGHEAERLALQLTPALAIWERAGQNQHAGKDVSYKAGKLLEEARYVTRDEFMSMHPTAAKRIRDHLATLDGTGAIPLLDSLGAFALDIKDDADFFASGRGWREKFWEARIRVSVRDLQLPKRLPASPGKGTRSKRKRGK